MGENEVKTEKKTITTAAASAAAAARIVVTHTHTHTHKARKMRGYRRYTECERSVKWAREGG